MPPTLPYLPERVRFAYSYDATGVAFTDVAGTVAASNGDRVRALRDWRPGGALAVNRAGSSNSPVLDATGLLFGVAGVASWLDTDVLQSSPFTILVNCGQSPGANALIACNANAETTTFLSSSSTDLYLYQGSSGSPTASAGTGTLIRGAVFNGSSSKIYQNGTITAVTAGAAAAWLARLGGSDPSFVLTAPILDVVGWDGALSDVELAAAAADMATWRARTPQSVPSGTEIELVVSLHLEGSTAAPGSASYTALASLIAAYPTLRLTVGASPSTYSSAGAVAADVDATFSEILALGSGDHELAQHDHAWNHYVTAAGVTPVTTPSFTGGTSADGYDLVLTSYSQADWATITAYGRALLVSRGFTAPTTYIAGGWLLDAPRREAIRTSGFLRDLSRLPTIFTETGVLSAPYLSGLLAAEYAGARSGDQPYVETLTAGDLIRFTANTAAADYDPGNVVQISEAKRVVQAKIASPLSRIRLVMSVHYDSTSIGRLHDALDVLFPWAASVGVTFAPRTAAQAS